MAAELVEQVRERLGHVFAEAGFHVENDVERGHTTVDVFARLGDATVAVHVPVHDPDTLSIDALVAAYARRQPAVNVDTQVIALPGYDAAKKEKNNAKNHGLMLWDAEDVNRLLSGSRNEQRETMHGLVNDVRISAQVRTAVHELAWKPYLADVEEDADASYFSLLQAVKQRIRREHYIADTTKEEREQHNSFFEDVAEEGKYGGEVTVTSAEKRYHLLMERLVEGEAPFDDEDDAERYLSYLQDVEGAYEDAQSHYFNAPNERKRVKRVVTARIHHLFRTGGTARFTAEALNLPIIVSTEEDLLKIEVEPRKRKAIERLRWVMNREGTYVEEDVTDDEGTTTTQPAIVFTYATPEECADAVMRVLDEFYQVDFNTFHPVDETLAAAAKQSLISRLTGR